MKHSKTLIVLFLAPAVILYFGLFLIPSVFGLSFSLFDWSGFTTEMKFIGVDNFTRLAGDDNFWLSLANTLNVLLVGGVVTFVLAFVLAMMINSGIQGKNFFRSLIFLPNVIATIAITTMWAFAIYGQRTGIIPNLLKSVGLTDAAKFTWMSGDHVFNSMVVSIVWVSVGYYVVLLLTGMDGVPTELYEAANLEGASPTKQMWFITIPMIWEIITVSMVMWGINALKVFEVPFAFMGAGTDPKLYTLNVYEYIVGFGKRDPIYQLGYATAIGLVLVLLAIVFNVILRRGMRRDRVEF
jgi:ABC-type sugar transport system permease subunit